MKKLLLLSLIFFLAGCSNQMFGVKQLNEWEKPGNEHLKLKADKSKILKSKIVIERVKLPSLFGATDVGTTSTSSVILNDTNSTTTSTVYYDYISTTTATNTPYFEYRKFSNAEVLPQRKDGKTPISFYSEDYWLKDGNDVFVIGKGATTTLEAFNAQTSLTLIEHIVQALAPPAYAIDTYNSSGTYTPPSNGTVDVLVVAGGAGGGGHSGGGGGAGGVLSSTSIPVTVQAYTITVGNGGAGNPYNTAPHYGGYGGTSSAFGLIAQGGGGGSDRDWALKGRNGGCGGGAASDAFGGGTGTQGYNGGNGANSVSHPGGGGGGAGGLGGTGTPGSSTVGGLGGTGTSSTISGVLAYYAAGGGGGALGGTGGAGGSSIGGNGATSTNGTNGVVNTGSGGGGGGSTKTGGDGSSGIVIIVFTASGGGAMPIINSSIINFE